MSYASRVPQLIYAMLLLQREREERVFPAMMMPPSPQRERGECCSER